MQTRIRPDYFKALRYVLFGGLTLYLGRTVLIPLAFALLLSFVLYPLARRLEKKGASRLTASLTGLMIVFLLAAGLLWLLINQTESLFKEWSHLREQFQPAMASAQEWIEKDFHVKKSDQQAWVQKFSDELPAKILPVVGEGLSSLASGGIVLFLISVYTVLLLQYRTNLVQVFYQMFPDAMRGSVHAILREVAITYYRFFTGVALVYLIVGILNSIGLWLMGVSQPILFGFIASVLTFIPYIGILVGGSLPVAVAWIEHGDPLFALGVVGVFVLVQFLEAYVIFPLVVSSRIQVNPLFVFLSMFVGNLLWGLSGMILFIPFTAILKLVADKTEELSYLSVLLGKARK